MWMNAVCRMSLCVVMTQCALMRWEGSAAPLLPPLGVEAYLVTNIECVYTLQFMKWQVHFLPLYTTKLSSISDTEVFMWHALFLICSGLKV